jgi:hypothetical protein
MSFDSIFRDSDEEEGDLDSGFLGKFDYGKSTCSLDEEEDGEAEDEWVTLTREAEEQSAQEAELERLIREAEELAVRDAAERALLEERRKQRREYQQRYRKGFVPPKKAKTVQRSTGRGKKENRKKLAYYLPPTLASALRETVEHLGIKRREFVQGALEAFFTGRPSLKSLTPPRSGGDLVFLYDEIPESLWNKVAALCRDKEGKRTANYYQVAEAALQKALKAV